MRRFAQTVLLKDDPEIIRQYEAYHANPWPEVIEGTRNCGVLRVFIYRFGRQLFMFMETVDDFDMDDFYQVAPDRWQKKKGGKDELVRSM